MSAVSVIIPVLDEASTIGRLLDCLKVQDCDSRFEVIVVDGGSTDGTRKIVGSRQNIRLIVSPSGVSRQRNAGAAVASGDLLVFLDADTAPHPDFLRGITRAYRKLNYAAACPWFVPATRRPDIHAVYGILNVLFYLSQFRYHTGAGVCIATPRTVFEQVGGFDETLHLGEDVDYLRRAATVGRHRHLLLPLTTSARRFESEGVIRTTVFYARISPALMFGDRDRLRTYQYAPVRVVARRGGLQ